jgi:hypothetical protein
MPVLAWTPVLLFVLPQVAGITGICHSAQPVVEMGFLELFAQVDLNLDPPDLYPQGVGLQV